MFKTALPLLLAAALIGCVSPSQKDSTTEPVAHAVGAGATAGTETESTTRAVGAGATVSAQEALASARKK